MYEDDYREVYFGDYCKTCKYEKRPEEQIPCCYCLEEPLNLYSHKPVRWEGKKGYEDYIRPEPTEPVEPEKPAIKNLFNEDGTGYSSGAVYSLEKETHTSIFTTNADTTTNRSSNPIITLPLKDCLGKTLYVRADNTITSMATAFSFWIQASYRNGMNDLLGEISTFGGSPSILIPENAAEFGAKDLTVHIVMKSSRDGIKLPKGSYVKLIKLMFSWEATDEWSPYKE